MHRSQVDSTNKAGKICTGGFGVGDTVRLVNDWLPAEAKAKRCKIEHFSKHDRVVFATVRWLGTSVKDYAEKFGTMFPLDELRKI